MYPLIHFDWELILLIEGTGGEEVVEAVEEKLVKLLEEQTLLISKL